MLCSPTARAPRVRGDTCLSMAGTIVTRKAHVHLTRGIAPADDARFSEESGSLCRRIARFRGVVSGRRTAAHAKGALQIESMQHLCSCTIKLGCLMVVKHTDAGAKTTTRKCVRTAASARMRKTARQALILLRASVVSHTLRGPDFRAPLILTILAPGTCKNGFKLDESSKQCTSKYALLLMS
jgi:cytochrome b